MVDLRRKYPREVARYLEPIFRDFKQESVLARVDPKLAWQVFAPAYVPPPELAAKVKALAVKLDAENFADREAASRELAAMGAPAAMALTRLGRANMSDEQLSRIDVLTAPYKPLPDDQVAKLRNDRFFLLDCLAADD